MLTLRQLVKEVNAELEFEALTFGHEHLSSDVSGWIPSGVLLIDLLCRGGVPLGRVVEAFGPPLAGKSTWATHVMVSCQQAGGLAVLLDSEATFSRRRALRMGLDLSALVELHADTLESGFGYLTKTVSKVRDAVPLPKPVVAVWDTIGSAPSRTERDYLTDGGEKFGGGMMERPRIVREALRTLTTDLAKQQVALILLNQVTVGPFGMESPLGYAIKHHASIRLRFMKKEELEHTKLGPFGIMSAVRLIKNKLDGAFPRSNEVLVPIHFLDGIQDDVSLVSWLVDEKVPGVKLSGSWYKLTAGGKGKELNVRYQDLRRTFAEHPELRAWAHETVGKRFVLQDEEAVA